MHSISRLSLHLSETSASLPQVKNLTNGFWHPSSAISLLSSLTNSAAHSFLPTDPSYTDSVFSLEPHSSTSRFTAPLHPLPFQVQTRVPVFKIRQRASSFIHHIICTYEWRRYFVYYYFQSFALFINIFNYTMTKAVSSLVGHWPLTLCFHKRYVVIDNNFIDDCICSVA